MTKTLLGFGVGGVMCWLGWDEMGSVGMGTFLGLGWVRFWVRFWGWDGSEGTEFS